MGSTGYLLAFLMLGLVTVSPTLGEEEKSVSDAACTFTIDFLKSAAEEEEGNIVTSPVSVGAVLAMLQQGAKGETANQIEKVLSLSAKKSREAFSNVATFLKGKQNNVTLEWANGIYVRDDFELNEQYKKVVEENFRSIVDKKNFTYPSTEETVNHINKWIGDVTHGEIKDLLKSSMIDVDTVMILINAIYFKGVWASKFQQVRTRPGSFHLNADNKRQAYFMRKEEELPAGEDSTLGIKWVQLPYQDEKFSMLFILPIEKNGLQKVIENMNGSDLKRLISSTETRHVNLGIPKFNLKWKSSLVQLLRKMGLSDIFSSSANLGGISVSNQPLTVSEMIHQANVEVDEDGTIASGVTVGFVQVLSLIVYDDEMIFYADHPFLAFIIDKENKIPLFAAKIRDPTGGKHIVTENTP